MITLEELLIWRGAQLRAAAGALFMGFPETWFEDPHWFCPSGHVSGVFLKTESADRCLACREPVVMGPALSEAAFMIVCREIVEKRLGDA